MAHRTDRSTSKGAHHYRFLALADTVSRDSRRDSCTSRSTSASWRPSFLDCFLPNCCSSRYSLWVTYRRRASRNSSLLVRPSRLATASASLRRVGETFMETFLVDRISMWIRLNIIIQIILLLNLDRSDSVRKRHDGFRIRADHSERTEGGSRLQVRLPERS